MLEQGTWVEPSEEERERLYLLIEECNEVIHAASKILRFGSQEYYAPRDETNKESLEKEIGQLLFIIDLLVSSGDLNDYKVLVSKLAKYRACLTYTKHQKEALGNIAYEK